MVIDGVEGKQYRGPFGWEGAGGDAVFSPDSRRVAYRAHAGDNWLVVVDGKPGRVSAGGPAGFQSGQPWWPTSACRDYNRHFVVVMAKRARPMMASSRIPTSPGKISVARSFSAPMDGTSRMSPAEGRRA